jgi:hypothetical protein
MHVASLSRSRVALLRVIVLISGMALVGLAVFAAMLAAQVLGAGAWLWSGLRVELTLAGLDVASRGAWLAVALVAGATGVATLWAAIRQPPRLAMIELTTRPNRTLYRGAKVRISERAMLAMLAHAAEQVEGVREAMPELVLRRSGWRVGCTLSVWASAQLPACSAQVEQALRHALLVHTGIPIQSVSLTVHELPIGAAAHMLTMEAP